MYYLQGLKTFSKFVEFVGQGYISAGWFHFWVDSFISM